MENIEKMVMDSKYNIISLIEFNNNKVCKTIDIANNFISFFVSSIEDINASVDFVPYTLILTPSNSLFKFHKCDDEDVVENNSNIQV